MSGRPWTRCLCPPQPIMHGGAHSERPLCWHTASFYAERQQKVPSRHDEPLRSSFDENRHCNTRGTPATTTPIAPRLTPPSSLKSLCPPCRRLASYCCTLGFLQSRYPLHVSMADGRLSPSFCFVPQDNFHVIAHPCFEADACRLTFKAIPARLRPQSAFLREEESTLRVAVGRRTN